MSRGRPAFLAAALWLLSACAAAQDAPVFQHEFADGPAPWTGQPFDAAPGKFTFALIADLTGGERPGVFAVAVEQLRLLRPDRQRPPPVQDDDEGPGGPAGEELHGPLHPGQHAVPDEQLHLHGPAVHLGQDALDALLVAREDRADTVVERVVPALPVERLDDGAA